MIKHRRLTEESGDTEPRIGTAATRPCDGGGEQQHPLARFLSAFDEFLYFPRSRGITPGSGSKRW